MLTAYVDETGHEGNDLVVLAGFLGNEDQWKACESGWRVGLGRRKHLHMKSLRWSKPNRIEPLLSKLGPVPHDAGLQAVYAAVKVADYADLVDGTVAERVWKGYIIDLLGLIDVVSKHIPAHETFKLVMEAQDTYEIQAQLVYKACDARTPDGRRKLVSLEFVPKDECSLTQPADYLAYALHQEYRDPKSLKSGLCAPILKNRQPALVRDHLQQKDLLRDFVKWSLGAHPDLMRTRASK